ncbi:phosphate/phosphite/phosphonate ABC transporter substrate-binding protein [Curvibacter sp. RS43]|uniref:Phosphate/phosphite/phosphonate ABC transporter substrate-binding protein n=1 Tax=Curvibacter microcysteis TaxID=3026419 RepID=A0ABT5MGR8_9BURK|nr:MULTISPECIES: phosphate/phosphite/phosphonate ABC transporter substrate-binding protein [unclassified Curvibacter]MDD0810500.1 phosphate/phosphite/phosphonate ABC transporter substrate-binding protein [Curvibacter sp. RS43]MDD0815763.1 phosphate/phosphite/phosphonate ABC transporter substrate-binding protein [Curvibacter sp. HBC28]
MAARSMNRRLAQALTALSLLAPATFGWAQSPPAEPNTYRFSPVNQYGINLTAAYWNPIIAYVSEKSGIKLQLKIGRTSADTTAYVLAQEVEFVFSNHLFSPEREKLGWKVFGRRLTPPLHAQIVVPADSPITELAQLQGKDIAFPGPEALVAYKFPTAHLMSKKIEVKSVFGGNMDAAFVQLGSGKVVAVGTNSQLAEGYARRENKKLRVLWSSPPLYDLALMSAAGVPDKVTKAVAQAFLGMHQDPKGRDILQKASEQVGLTAEAYFIQSDGSEYGTYRDFYRNAPASLR